MDALNTFLTKQADAVAAGKVAEAPFDGVALLAPFDTEVLRIEGGRFHKSSDIDYLCELSLSVGPLVQGTGTTPALAKDAALRAYDARIAESVAALTAIQDARVV